MNLFRYALPSMAAPSKSEPMVIAGTVMGGAAWSFCSMASYWASPGARLSIQR
ncbi:hypothetical protein [Kutzneria sp. 744]|uniref:hypothetical protein n=1 Tax=Kutzneria sp. (strain 744) TaxID=345341 RepID=UPI001E5C54BD|nr:hypothetical protein [Kutzneria sp. 744]